MGLSSNTTSFISFLLKFRVALIKNETEEPIKIIEEKTLEAIASYNEMDGY